MQRVNVKGQKDSVAIGVLCMLRERSCPRASNVDALSLHDIFNDYAHRSSSISNDTPPPPTTLRTAPAEIFARSPRRMAARSAAVMTLLSFPSPT